jgi:steroid 5-alpha reductase family enzyme
MTPDERKKSPHKDIKDGFLQSGLFFYSRHPNYFAEQAMWIVIYLFTISVTGL